MKKNILEEIAQYAYERVQADKERISLNEVREDALRVTRIAAIMGFDKIQSHRFKEALSTPELSFICEIKKASPSKGIIDVEFPYQKIAMEYEKAGADCISCLTEPKWFLGSDAIFEEIREIVKIPMLRKDFVVDEYQIYQAKSMGANSILLICSILEPNQLRSYLQLVEELGMDALVETHNEEEISMALDAGAEIIGVNNRNLKDFSVDVNHAAALRDLVPKNCIFVAESGIKNSEDIQALRAAGVNAVLIGETLMRARDKKAVLQQLQGLN